MHRNSPNRPPSPSANLAVRAPKAGIDESAIATYGGAVSLPVAPGLRRRGAVEIVDDGGIESLEIEG